MKTHYPRPPILDTIPRDRHAVIEASAGTGKTYTIEHLVVELILRGGHDDRRGPRPDLHRASGRRASQADPGQ